MGKLNIKNFLLLAALTLTPLVDASAKVSYLDFTQVVKNGDLGNTKADDLYYSISSIEVEQLDTDYASNKVDTLGGNKDLGTIIMNLDKLIAFGTKVWEIVKEGRPVSTVNMGKPISVLPKTQQGDDAFYRMSGWSAPTQRRYRVRYKNGFGMEVVQFDYTVHFQHGGQFEDKGSYVTGLSVNASNVSVAWGFEFDASTELMNISNRGSSEEPIAGATMQVSYKVSSVLREITSSESFHVAGNGEIIKY